MPRMDALIPTIVDNFMSVFKKLRTNSGSAEKRPRVNSTTSAVSNNNSVTSVKTHEEDDSAATSVISTSSKKSGLKRQSSVDKLFKGIKKRMSGGKKKRKR